MPWPMRPAPATKTRSIAMAQPTARPSAASSRSAAAYGSSRGPRPRRGRRRSVPPVRGLAAAGPHPLPDDRPRPGSRRGGGRRPVAARGLATGRRDAGPAPRAAPARPAPVDAVVTRTSGRFGRGRSRRRAVARGRSSASASPRSCAAVRAAPGLSPLLTTTRSATSSRPALIAWTSSPISGASSTTVVSAAAATSTSLCPVPTVSIARGRSRRRPARPPRPSTSPPARRRARATPSSG